MSGQATCGGWSGGEADIERRGCCRSNCTDSAVVKRDRVGRRSRIETEAIDGQCRRVGSQVRCAAGDHWCYSRNLYSGACASDVVVVTMTGREPAILGGVEKLIVSVVAVALATVTNGQAVEVDGVVACSCTKTKTVNGHSRRIRSQARSAAGNDRHYRSDLNRRDAGHAVGCHSDGQWTCSRGRRGDIDCQRGVGSSAYCSRSAIGNVTVLLPGVSSKPSPRIVICVALAARLARLA